MIKNRIHKPCTRSPGATIPKQPAGAGGFTLTELMVVVGIIGIVATLAIPAYLKMQPHLRLKSAASEIGSALMNARMAAVSNNVSMKVEFDLTNDAFNIYKYNPVGPTYDLVKSVYDGEGWRDAKDRWIDIDLYYPGDVAMTVNYRLVDSDVDSAFDDGQVIFLPSGSTTMIISGAGPGEAGQAVYIRNKKATGEIYRVTVNGFTGLVKVQKKEASGWGS